MIALKKTLAASALAFGLVALYGGTAGATSSHNNWYNKDSKAKHTSYEHEKKHEKKQNFYHLKWEERKRLCVDDKHWNDWKWYFGDKRDKYCEEFKDHPDCYLNKGHYSKHGDGKKYGHHDNKRYDKKHDDRKYGYDGHKDRKDYGKQVSYHDDNKHYNHKNDDRKHYDNKKDYGRHHDNGYNGKKHDDKKYGYTDRKHDDNKYVESYKKNEHLNASFSEKKSEHEKKATYVAYDSHNKDSYHNDHDKKDYGKKYGHHDNKRDHSYNEDRTSYKAAEFSEKEHESSVEANVDQRTVVNNYVAVYGDNNVVHNNVSVANTASVEQKVSSSEVNARAVEYTNSSDSSYGGYGHDGKSSSDVSYTAAEYSEKSSSHEVKQSTSYHANESYTQVEKDHGHDYDKKGDYKDDCYEQKDDCYGRVY